MLCGPTVGIGLPELDDGVGVGDGVLPGFVGVASGVGVAVAPALGGAVAPPGFPGTLTEGVGELPPPPPHATSDAAVTSANPKVASLAWRMVAQS